MPWLCVKHLSHRGHIVGTSWPGLDQPTWGPRDKSAPPRPGELHSCSHGNRTSSTSYTSQNLHAVGPCWTDQVGPRNLFWTFTSLISFRSFRFVRCFMLRLISQYSQCLPPSMCSLKMVETFRHQRLGMDGPHKDVSQDLHFFRDINESESPKQMKTNAEIFCIHLNGANLKHATWSPNCHIVQHPKGHLMVGNFAAHVTCCSHKTTTKREPELLQAWVDSICTACNYRLLVLSCSLTVWHFNIVRQVLLFVCTRITLSLLVFLHFVFVSFSSFLYIKVHNGIHNGIHNVTLSTSHYILLHHNPLHPLHPLHGNI